MTADDRRALAALISGLSLYDGLDPADLEEMAAGLRPRRLAAGEMLMGQGELPDGAYFLLSGTAEVLTKLPGGGETQIAEVGPGSLLGELALIRSTRRGATVRAQSPLEVLFADRRHFRAALAQMRPAAMKVSRNITGILARRLLRQYIRIRDHVEAQPRRNYFVRKPAPVPAAVAGTGSSFDVRVFLPILPGFDDFDEHDLDRLIDLGRIEHVLSATDLDPGRDGVDHCWVVVRGAVVSCLRRGKSVHQLGVQGPGGFGNIGALLNAEPSPVRHFVPNEATLLMIPRGIFRQSIAALDPFSQRFRTVVNRYEAAMIVRASNHLTRLVAQSRHVSPREDSLQDIVI